MEIGIQVHRGNRFHDFRPNSLGIQLITGARSWALRLDALHRASSYVAG